MPISALQSPTTIMKNWSSQYSSPSLDKHKIFYKMKSWILTGQSHSLHHHHTLQVYPVGGKLTALLDLAHISPARFNSNSHC